MIEQTVEELNEELDALSDQTYPSLDQAWEAVSAVLGNNGITVPNGDIEDEMLFRMELDESEDYMLFFVADCDENDPPKYDLFAGVINQDDLNTIDGALAEAE
jgi:hypothetical protein